MKYDKKQLPQLIALGVLTAGAGTYTVVRLSAPGPVFAQVHPPVSAAKRGASALAATKPGPAAPAAQPGAGADPAAPADPGAAPPPGPAMRDPFAVGYAVPVAAAAAPPAPAAASALPPLPGKPLAGRKTAAMPGLSPLPVSPPLSPFGLPSAPAAPVLPGRLPGGSTASAGPSLLAAPPPPAWTVTGVLQGDGGQVAILRSGEARRIVRSGDFVDSTYRVASVSRTAVVLKHGAAVYQLALGAAKAAPGAAAPAPPAFSAPAFSAPPPAPKPPPALLDSALPAYRPARPQTPLLPLAAAAPRLALASGTISVPAATVSAEASKRQAAAQVAGAVSFGQRLLGGSVVGPHKE